MRRGRRLYYDLFSEVYDSFIRFHAGGEKDATRRVLVGALGRDFVDSPRVLDVCCGTGDLLMQFAAAFPRGFHVGCDFSHGMLLRAAEKGRLTRIKLVEGDAGSLPFQDEVFHVVSCSHALYEFRRDQRWRALEEMKRVLRLDGLLLVMEHEVPVHMPARFFFMLRLLSMGADDAWEILQSRLDFFTRLFPRVSVRTSPTGRSRLILCRKM